MLQLRSRDEELKSVIRYKQNTVCKPMYYTPNLWIHVNRVTWLSEELSIQLGLSPELTKKVVRRAMFHDDSEIIAGDIATPVKQNWSQEEKKSYEEKCANAIPILVQAYGIELGNDYKEILLEEENKNSLSQNLEQRLIHAIIEYADKLDALMETLHELNSGSKGFLGNMRVVFGKDMTCWEYIIGRVKSRHKHLIDILSIDGNNSLLNFKQIEKLNINTVVKKGTSHTESSVQKDIGIEIYDIWKKLHMTKGNKEHQKYLYTQNISY